MKILVTILLLVTLTRCSEETTKEKEDLIKRALEHRSNLALLTSVNLGDDKSLNALSPNPASIEVDNRNLPHENLLLTAPPPLTNHLSFPYAPEHRFHLPNLPTVAFQHQHQNQNPSALVYENLPLEPGTNIHPPIIPVPAPLNIIRTVQVPIQVKVPVEVPKPYEVRVPHPVPVPVHVRVPVPISKPYPVQVTKTVAVPVEKPVYIRVPQPVEVPVPQPYPVAVPQPVHIRVPVVVRFAEGGGVNGFASELANLDGTPFGQTVPGGSLNVESVTEPALAAPTTGRPSKGSFSVSGNGLLPPPPPAKLPHVKGVVGGLLNSYVASKQGGVYRRSTKYQTAEYHRIW